MINSASADTSSADTNRSSSNSNSSSSNSSSSSSSSSSWMKSKTGGGTTVIDSSVSGALASIINRVAAKATATAAKLSTPTSFSLQPSRTSDSEVPSNIIEEGKALVFAQKEVAKQGKGGLSSSNSMSGSSSRSTVSNHSNGREVASARRQEALNDIKGAEIEITKVLDAL